MVGTVASNLALVVAPFDVSYTSFNSCMSSSFYGNYKEADTLKSVFFLDEACLASWVDSDIPASSAHVLFDFDTHNKQFVWLERADVDRSLQIAYPADLDILFDHLDSRGQFLAGQEVLSVSEDQPYDIVYRTADSALLRCNQETSLTIDTLLPPFWKSSILPSTPVSSSPVSIESEAFLAQIREGLSLDTAIQYIAESISVPQLRNDIHFLTGEDPKSPIISRHSFAEGSRTAAEWLKERFEGTGASCELMSFLEGFAPNVIWYPTYPYDSDISSDFLVSRYPSTVNTTSTVLISAHYDSRPSFGSTRAPGGNDDGSGTISILGVARALARAGVKFKSNVEIVAFAGEEQGLLGSKAYARQ
jgi:hypothetical protein